MNKPRNDITDALKNISDSAEIKQWDWWKNIYTNKYHQALIEWLGPCMWIFFYNKKNWKALWWHFSDPFMERIFENFDEKLKKLWNINDILVYIAWWSQMNENLRTDLDSYPNLKEETDEMLSQSKEYINNFLDSRWFKNEQVSLNYTIWEDVVDLELDLITWECTVIDWKYNPKEITIKNSKKVSKILENE